jgi:two-component system NarL family sensor kinase
MNVLLKAGETDVTYVVYFGTFGMLLLAVGLIVFVIFHQRKVIYYQLRMRNMQADHQKMLLQATLESQEEERQRIAADLHDDAGPLLATVRLYLNENLVHQDMATQLQSIHNAKQIVDETIQLIRNISHSLIPPTLKNFGLESAMSDLIQKINGTGSIHASCRFNDYSRRLKLEQELSVFRVLQELINNIFYLRIHHDGTGLTQTEFEKLRDNPTGLGLKNIQGRLKILGASIFFEKDSTNTYYKVTLELPADALI